ncbi:bifunctional diguanylate cyclase/phosphodiesterase [Kangiella sp. HZ709]|uniref:sensor domain-containing protein n=1 Tax=Kangiella sp. HZ709 TaxID=2666328 RepID=UPI0012B0B03A|nr:bifunctional diguanylate cyclase/phosphodiesterase [Kangiella sp. HZ709]MRX27879.1 EAL domain-containing protein [Kangiella sp. HZ709]
MPNTPPIPESLLQTICQQDYTAILVCNREVVIKVFSHNYSLSASKLMGLEYKNWLPQELIEGKTKRSIVSLPDLGSNDQYVASMINLPKGKTLFELAITLQPVPSNLLNDAAKIEKANIFQKDVFEQLPVCLFHLNYKTKLFTKGLADYAQLLGYTEAEIEKMPDGIFTPIHPDDIDAVLEQRNTLINAEDGTLASVKFRVQCKDNSWRLIQANSAIYERDANGKPISGIGALLPLYQSVNEYESLQQQERYYKKLVENSYDCILVFDKDFKVTYMSPSVTKLSGYTEEDLIGKTFTPFIYDEDREESAKHIKEVAGNSGMLSVIERRIVHKKGHIIWIESRLANHLDDPAIQGVTINFHDITERKKSEKKIHNLANYDPLTELPNRYLLKKRLLKGLADASKKSNKLSLMYIDLDGFKDINDSLGHTVGDALLKSVAQTIQSCLRETDTLARVGGDEFAIVLPDSSEKESGAIATRILEQFRTPFKADKHRVQSGASIGISIYPKHTEKSEDLFRFADIAMYSAKKDRNSYEFYEIKHTERENRRRSTEKKLKLAIANGDLRLYYQPRVDIQTGAIKSVEALCRWYDPDSGDVSPGLFIPIAEESNLINDLSRLVTDMACRQVNEWRNMGIDTSVALNLSIKDLKNFNIVRQFNDTMSMYNIEGSSLEVEITESAAMTDVLNTVKILNQFKELDIKLSIDDFGKGYSSLAYLSQLPVDNLKIDMYFVSQLGSQKRDRLINVNIIRSIISLAQSLDLHTVGEGIETVQQMSILKSLGCDMGQGMLYCRPMSSNAITDILKQGRISFPSQV